MATKKGKGSKKLVNVKKLGKVENKGIHILHTA